ncbi:unnamed protein product [Pylaiella littoralis]
MFTAKSFAAHAAMPPCPTYSVRSLSVSLTTLPLVVYYKDTRRVYHITCMCSLRHRQSHASSPLRGIIYLTSVMFGSRSYRYGSTDSSTAIVLYKLYSSEIQTHRAVTDVVE